MAPSSPSHTTQGKLIFGLSDDDHDAADDDDDSEGPLPDVPDGSNTEHGSKRQSMYVELFEEMVYTVLKEEPLLFARDELDCFKRYNVLSYGARYLLIRLCLRKTDQWMKLADLKYQRELGDKGTLEAMKELCHDKRACDSQAEAQEDVKPKVESVPERDVIDLTLDDEDEEGKPQVHPEALDDDVKPWTNETPHEPDYSFFAWDEQHADLYDLLDILRVDDLKELTKTMKLHPRDNKRDTLIRTLLSSTSTQQTLNFASSSKGTGKGKSKTHQQTLHGYGIGGSKKHLHQATLLGFVQSKPGASVRTAYDRLRELAMKKIGACIKLNPDVVALFRRVNLVYFRCTVPTPLLTPAILARSRKWSYAHNPQPEPPPSSTASTSTPPSTSASAPPATPPTPYSRTTYKLWPTRAALLDYEDALRLEAYVDDILGTSASPTSSYATAYGVSARSKGKERAWSATTRATATPARSSLSASVSPEKLRRGSVLTASVSPAMSRTTAGTSVRAEEQDVLPVVPGYEEGETPRQRGARQVVEIFEHVWATWKEVVKAREELEAARAAKEAAAVKQEEAAQQDLLAGADILAEEADAQKEHEEQTTSEPQVKVEEDWSILRQLGKCLKKAEHALSQEPVVEQDELSQNSEVGPPQSQASQPETEDMDPKWLQRFHPGHILTRIVCKGAYALGILKEHKRELEVLDALLAQRVFRPARRGRWHERRALLLMTHFEQTPDRLRQAWTGVRDALLDPDTHIVYRPKLYRRLVTLQKKLRALGHTDILEVDNPGLAKCDEIHIVGERVHVRVDAAGNLVVDSVAARPGAENASKRRKVEKQDQKQTKLAYVVVKGPMKPPEKPVDAKTVKTGKSVWRGREGEEVNVESFALQHYESKGYKGLHCEGRIIATLFAMLFWDIIFKHIPGAFETPYQAAPLDIAEDTFYHARRDVADARLKEIREGRAAEILLRTWDEHAERKTFCVGLKWDLCTREDWVEILEGFEPKGLEVVCQTLLEDYVNRTAGMPDLFLWHPEKKKCKFVEVKGPGDTLQENQKLWIDVLLQARLEVEVCHVSDVADKAASKGKGKAKAKGKKGTTTRTKAPPSAKKRKRTDDSSDADDFELPESEEESEPRVDYAQLARDIYLTADTGRQASETTDDSSLRRSSRTRSTRSYSSAFPLDEIRDDEATEAEDEEAEAESAATREQPEESSSQMQVEALIATPLGRGSERARRHREGRSIG